MQKTKSELRKYFLVARASLSDSETTRGEKRITNRFISYFDISKFRNLHLYLPIKEKKEIDTLNLASVLQKQNFDLKFSAPRVSSGPGRLDHYWIDIGETFEINRWGIPQPKPDPGMMTNILELDAVIVPLLCFDRAGHRVGYGKGYYDQFLSGCGPRTKKIGLSYFEAVEKISDIEDSDVKLDYCVTPDEVYHFGE